MVWFGGALLTTPTRPVCFKCGVPTWLIRIEPDKSGCVRRTFECPRCHNQMTEVTDLEKAA